MQIRKYQESDCRELAALFYNTVHTVNAADYTEEQRNAWATGQVDLEQWNRSFLEHDTIVAVEGGRIIGFGDMDGTGYLDRLYVHKDFQRKGAASAICDALEKALEHKAQNEAGKAGQKSGTLRMTTHASITARTFFEKRGYRVVKEQQVERKGISLTNFVMEKEKEFT